MYKLVHNPNAVPQWKMRCTSCIQAKAIQICTDSKRCNYTYSTFNSYKQSLWSITCFAKSMLNHQNPSVNVHTVFRFESDLKYFEATKHLTNRMTILLARHDHWHLDSRADLNIWHRHSWNSRQCEKGCGSRERHGWYLPTPAENVKAMGDGKACLPRGNGLGTGLDTSHVSFRNGNWKPIDKRCQKACRKVCQHGSAWNHHGSLYKHFR